MMLVLLIFLVTFTLMAGSVAIGGAAILARRRQLPPPPAAPPQLPSGDRDPLTLRVRDVVTHGGETYLVEGRITFEEIGQRWFAYRLADQDRDIWLRAQEQDELRTWILREEPSLRSAEPPGEEVTFEDRTYRLVRRGEANVEHQGRTWRESVRRTPYFVYHGPGDHALFIERADEGFQGQVGRRVEPRMLELLPGDLVKRH